MNLSVTLITLRGLALLSLLSGKSKLSDTLYLTADLIAAGKATDEQLQLVAEKLKSRRLEENDWLDVYERINQSRDVLHAPEPPAGQGGRARVNLLGVMAVALGLALLFVAPSVFSAEPTVRQASLSWLAVTQDVEGNAITGVTYNVYRGARGTSVAQKTRVATNLTALSFLDTNRPAGVEECYVVTAVKTVEGGPSNEGCKSYPGLAPASTSLTVQ